MININTINSIFYSNRNIH